MVNIINDQDWEQRYQQGDTPWAHYEPVNGLIELITSYLEIKSSILEIGCGLGIETVALAQNGFKVTAYDVSKTAIKQAIQNAKSVNVDVTFHLADPITSDLDGPYDAMLDVAVFHRYGLTNNASSFIKQVHQNLKQDGYWFCLAAIRHEILAKEQEVGVAGPPSVELNDIKHWVRDSFEIMEIVDTTYQVSRGGQVVSFPVKIFVFKKK